MMDILKRSFSILRRYMMALLLTSLSTPIVTQAQVDVGDPFEFYLRMISESNDSTDLPSFNLRPQEIRFNASDLPVVHPWVKRIDRAYLVSNLYATPPPSSDGILQPDIIFYAPEIRVTHNNKFAWGANDGALWQGRGLNHSYSMGIGFRYGNVSAAIRPKMVYSENRDFALSPYAPRAELNQFAEPRLYVDMPQRFGEDPVSRMDPGNSFIKYSQSGFEGGFSTQSYWVGPGVRNALILSNNAPGFLHGFVGTSRPFAIPGGKMESRWFWGGLRESDYFDDIQDNNLRYVTGFTFNYSPEFIPGLHAGFNRVAYRYYPEDGLTLSDIFLAFTRRPDHPRTPTRDVDFYRQRMIMSSFFLRYVIPEPGFEWYFEWGRNDYRRTIRDFIGEPELNRAYTAGMMKRFYISDTKRLVALVEFNQLENNSPAVLHRTRSQLIENDATMWYMNNYVRQGYSHMGQVMGAAIGPGSSAQALELKYFDTWGMIGGSIGRTVYHNDRLFMFWQYYINQQPFAWNTLRKLQEVEIHYGLNALLFLPYNLELQVDYRLGSFENRNNVMDYDVANTNISATLRYGIRAFRIR